MCSVEAERLAELAGTVGELAPVRGHASSSGHELELARLIQTRGFERSNENRVRYVEPTNHDVEGPATTVEEKHVRGARRSVHGLRSSSSPPSRAVGGQVLRSTIGLRLHDASRRGALGRRVHNELADQPPRHGEDISFEKAVAKRNPLPLAMPLHVSIPSRLSR